MSLLSYPLPAFEYIRRTKIVTLSPTTVQLLRMAVDLQPLQMTIFGIAAGLSLLFIISTFQRSRHRYPQGPRPFPVLGNVGFLKNLHADPDRQLLRLRDRWGTMCMLWYGSSPVIILNGPKAAREMLNEVREKDHWQFSGNREQKALEMMRIVRVVF